MILKGNQRGGAKQLALHLMKDENEHVEVHELRGFVSHSLMGALNEAYAVSRGTRCKQFLYSLSLNPPQRERVGTEDFVAAIDQVERELGLAGQPRAIVFHEKEGRRHAHAIWSRIDIQAMKAVHLFRDHERLQSLSRALFLEHGWRMPDGLADKSRRDPRNFTLAQWQQAKRIGKDPKAIKTAIQDAWAISDTRAAFIHALEERGYRLARGDRRGFVAVDFQGEVYAIPKWADVRTKDVRKRLGEETNLPAVGEVQQEIAGEMLSTLGAFRRQVEADRARSLREFETRRRALVERQRVERRGLNDRIERRRTAEAVERQGRFRKGLGGIWDRLRGEHRRIRTLNEQEADAAIRRDRAEMDALVFRQLDQRMHLNIFRLEAGRTHEGRQQDLQHDIETFESMRTVLRDAQPTRTRRRRRLGPEPKL